jgi:hypothetical protein
MRRWLKILAFALAVLIVGWAGPVIALNVIENRHSVDPRELIRDNPETYPLLKPLRWTDKLIVPNAEGVYVHSWTSGKVRLVETVHRYSSSLSALYAFSTQDPLLVRKWAAETVTSNPPSGLRADQVEVFCSHLISKPGTPHKCNAWNAWLRYGQYTMYIAITNAVLSGADFTVITRRVDAVVNRALL